jgi:SAM-dependent methyltransferase
MTTPFDYDQDPERFRLAARVTSRHLTTRSLYDHLAEVLAGLEPRRILDAGCGEGALGAALPAPLRSRVVGLDASWTMVAANPPPVVQADVTALPFLAGVFDAAVAVNVLDHLAEPAAAIGEAHRVLARGGMLVAATASRHDAPSWPRSGDHRPPASTPRTAPGWWRRSSATSGSNAGTPPWCGCPTPTRSATTWSRGSWPPATPRPPPYGSRPLSPSPSGAR